MKKYQPKELFKKYLVKMKPDAAMTLWHAADGIIPLADQQVIAFKANDEFSFIYNDGNGCISYGIPKNEIESSKELPDKVETVIKEVVKEVIKEVPGPERMIEVQVEKEVINTISLRDIIGQNIKSIELE